MNEPPELYTMDVDKGDKVDMFSNLLNDTGINVEDREFGASPEDYYGGSFKEDNENSVDDIKAYATNQPMHVIFDDLIGSSSLKMIANLFTVDARHMNMSMVFLT